MNQCKYFMKTSGMPICLHKVFPITPLTEFEDCSTCEAYECWKKDSQKDDPQ